MEDLPKERITEYVCSFVIRSKLREESIFIKESRLRGHIPFQGLRSFIYLNRAIHLELVTNLTTEAFMAALRHFTDRRGICSRLLPDNGTNFIGASRT